MGIVVCMVCEYPANPTLEWWQGMPACSPACRDACMSPGTFVAARTAARRVRSVTAWMETQQASVRQKVAKGLAELVIHGDDPALERDREAQRKQAMADMKWEPDSIEPKPRRDEPLRYPPPGKDISGNAIIIEQWHLPRDTAKDSPRVMIGVDPAYENDTTMFVTHTRHEGGIVRIPDMTAQQQADPPAFGYATVNLSGDLIIESRSEEQRAAYCGLTMQEWERLK